jgi:hypothetical protein
LIDFRRERINFFISVEATKIIVGIGSFFLGEGEEGEGGRRRVKEGEEGEGRRRRKKEGKKKFFHFCGGHKDHCGDWVFLSWGG